MFVVIVEFTLRPDARGRFIERARQQACDSLGKEEACRVFDVCIDPSDENRVVLYEVYDDEAAFEAHLASAHFRNFGDDVEAWVSVKKISRLIRV